VIWSAVQYVVYRTFDADTYARKLRELGVDAGAMRKEEGASGTVRIEEEQLLDLCMKMLVRCNVVHGN
jgi:hypothetical protein